MRKLMVTVFALAAFGSGVAEDMPTLNWVGRKDAERATKEVVMKILREDKSLSYAGGTRSVASACQTGLEEGGSATLTQRTQRAQRNTKSMESAPTLFDAVDADVSSASATGRATSPQNPVNPVNPVKTTAPTTDNILVHGDNLEALHALLPFYAGRVKCIYIDPPYNTGNMFENYDDNLEHSTWLSIMYPRLKLLREFLAPDGVFIVQIDKNECAYLKVILDEIFGRQNFITTIAVRMSATSGFKIEHADKTIVKNTEYLHVYSGNLRLKPMYEGARYDSHYSYILREKTPGEFVMEALCDQKEVAEELKKYELRVTAKSLPVLYDVSRKFREFVSANRDVVGRTHTAPAEALSRKEELMKMLATDKHVCDFVASNGDRYKVKKTNTTLNQYIPISLKFQKVDSYKGYEEELSNILGDWWDGFFYDMGNVEDEGMVVFNASKKPERLLFRIFTMFTNPGDLVLDSFLGSGTTAAVAQKMNRRWIGIEMGEHAKTHCAVRMKKVIDGEQGGISKAVGWKGGGGFRYYELGEAILQKDGTLTADIPFETMAAHVWFTETKRPYGVQKGEGEQRTDSSDLTRRDSASPEKTTVLGVHDGAAYALLYNGILGDRSVSGGNVLTKKTFKVIKEDLDRLPEGDREYKKLIVYAEACRLSEDTLRAAKIEFRQTPYDLVVRK